MGRTRASEDMALALDPEETVYWQCLTPDERKGRKGKEFRAFFKEWTKGLTLPVKELTYVQR